MIYLDNAATTACAEEVVHAMVPLLRDKFANASSTDHILGVEARKLVDSARESIAAMVGARPEDVIFTSGSTEANNLALSVSRAVLTSPVEHPSVLDPFKARSRFDDSYVAIDHNGLVQVEKLQQQLDAVQARPMLSLIATNNETGAEQNIPLLAKCAAMNSALLHLDATQSVSTQAINFKELGIDGMSISAHKIFGPKGIGALIASARLRRELRPRQLGGGHERGFRSGTLNVPGIVGFGVSAHLVLLHRAVRRSQINNLRSRFLSQLRDDVGGDLLETIVGTAASPHVLSIRIKGVNSRALLGSVADKIAFSLGSACATNKVQPSHVLTALGIDRRAISETFRISFSHEQSIDEVTSAATIISAAVKALNEYSQKR